MIILKNGNPVGKLTLLVSEETEKELLKAKFMKDINTLIYDNFWECKKKEEYNWVDLNIEFLKNYR